MTKKHITAPLSYDPGKGRPKEYLAYLNWQEMQALQRLNGGNMERGPRGLPSFPPADAIGSNQTPGTGNWTGAPGSGTTSTGAGGTSGGGSDSGNLGGNVSSTSASAANTANTPESSDTDAQQAAAVNNAISAANNQALNQDASRGGISSIPVGPQQTPVTIGGGQIYGTIAGMSQQASAPVSVGQTVGAIPSGFMSPQQQMADRMNTMYSPNALSDLYKGVGAFGISDPATRTGIQQSLLGQTIELSKSGNTLGYKSAPYVRSSGTLDPTEADVVMHWTGSANTKIPTLGLGNKGYGYGVVIDENGNVSYTKKFDEQGRYPQTWHTKGYNKNKIGIANIGIKPNPAQVRAVGALGREWFNPDATATSHGYVAGDLASERRARGEKFSGRPAAEGKALAAAFSSGMLSPSQFAQTGYPATSSPASVRLAEIDVTPAAVDLTKVEESYNPSVVSDPIGMAAFSALTKLPSLLNDFSLPSIPEGSTAQKAALGLAKTFKSDAEYQKLVNDEIAKAINRSGFSLADSFASGIGALRNAMGAPTAVAGKPYQDRLMTIDGITREVPAENFERMSPEDQARINEYQQAQRYDPNFSGPYGAVPNGNVADSGAPETVNPDDFVGPTYVTTDIQKIMEDQERKNRMGSQVIKRGAPFVGTGLSIAEGIQKLFTGKDIADYGTDLKNRYMQEGPEGRAALRAKYPDMRRFAVSIGDIPPNTGTQFASSGDLSRELGGKDNRQNYYMDQVAYSPPVYSGATKEPAMETGRPYKHYLWDLGVDVPSPGDPDYNDYVKYLKKRDNSSDV